MNTWQSHAHTCFFALTQQHTCIPSTHIAGTAVFKGKNQKTAAHILKKKSTRHFDSFFLLFSPPKYQVNQSFFTTSGLRASARTTAKTLEREPSFRETEPLVLVVVLVAVLDVALVLRLCGHVGRKHAPPIPISDRPCQNKKTEKQAFRKRWKVCLEACWEAEEDRVRSTWVVSVSWDPSHPSFLPRRAR